MQSTLHGYLFLVDDILNTPSICLFEVIEIFLINLAYGLESARPTIFFNINNALAALNTKKASTAKAVSA